MLTRRRFLTVLAGLPACGIALAACGSDGGSAGSEPQDDPSPDSPPDSSGPGSVPPLPVASDVLLKIESAVGAFTTAEYSFGRLPDLLVTNDRRAFRVGPQIEIFPPPMLASVEQITLTDEVIASLMTLAEEAGLFGEIPDYEAGQPNVADAGATVVTLVKDGKEFVHKAEALGLGGESGDARSTLRAFVDAALSLDIGVGEQFLADEYAIWARPMTLADFAGVEPQPSVVPWPLASLDLTTADTCLIVDSSDVQVAFEAANQQTLWEQAGNTYAIAVRTILPVGDACE